MGRDAPVISSFFPLGGKITRYPMLLGGFCTLSFCPVLLRIINDSIKPLKELKDVLKCPCK